jgi:ubiquinone biosynthesis protein
VVGKLFATARQFELTIQPQLILLQKTLLNIEGIGRMLDPDIDIWAVAHPVLKRILMQRYSPRRAFREIRRRFPEWLHAAPRMPDLAREWLQQAVAGDLNVRFASQDLAQLHAEARRSRRLLTGGLLGATLLLSATLLWTLAPGHGAWPPIVVAIVGALCFALAARPRRH